MGTTSIQAESDGFFYDRTEVAVDVVLSSAGGTSGLVEGVELEIQATVTMRSWDVYVNPDSGEQENGEEVSSPLSGVSIEFIQDWGNGWFANNNVATDQDGQVTLSYTMESDSAGIRAVVQCADSSVAEGSLNFDAPTVETWEFHHSEGSLDASIGCDDSTESLSPGDMRTVWVSVVNSSWDIETSSAGGTRVNNYQSSPAEGALITWTVDDGGAEIEAESYTDGDGMAYSTFTIGSSDATVTAWISYEGSNASNASMSLTLAGEGSGVPEYYSDGTANWFTFTDLQVDGSKDNLSPGTTRTISGVLQNYTCEVFTDGQGNYQYGNESMESAGGLTVYAAINGGDGSLSSGSVTTDGDGSFSVTFTGGTEASDVWLDVDDLWTNPSIITFTSADETWQQLENVTDYSITLQTASSGTFFPDGDSVEIIAGITASETEVWQNSQGAYRYEQVYYGPADGVNVSFTTSLGGSGSSMTNAEGNASYSIQMGNGPISIQAEISGYSGAQTSVTLEPAPVINWQYVGQEGTVLVTMSNEGSTTGLGAGEIRNVTAHVTFESWSVYADQDNPNVTKTGNESSGTAAGAPVHFTVTQGDGTLSTLEGFADSNGDISTTLTMGDQDITRISAMAEFVDATCTVDRVFHLAQWQMTGTGSDLTMTLNSSPSGYGATAQVTQRSWEIWTRGSETKTENVQTGPAINAEVVFSVTPAGGTVTPTTVFTAFNGSADTVYSVAETSTLKALATYSGKIANASIIIQPEGTGWVRGTDGEELALTLANTNPTTGTLECTVKHKTWQNWTRGIETARRSETEVNAEGASVSFSTLQGAATFAPATVVTSASGVATTTYQATAASTINASVTFGSALAASATVDVAANSSGGGNGTGGNGTGGNGTGDGNGNGNTSNPVGSESPLRAEFVAWVGFGISSSGGGMEDDPDDTGSDAMGKRQKFHYVLPDDTMPPTVEEDVASLESNIPLNGQPQDEWIISNSTPPPPVKATWYKFESYTQDAGPDDPPLFEGKRIKVTQTVDPLGAEQEQVEATTNDPATYDSWTADSSQYPSTAKYSVALTEWWVATVEEVAREKRKIYTDAKHYTVGPIFSTGPNSPQNPAVIPHATEYSEEHDLSTEFLSLGYCPLCSAQFDPLKIPSSGGVLATSSSFYRETEITYTRENGTNQTMTGRFGTLSKGKIRLSWRTDWPFTLTDDEKASWLSRFLLVTTTYTQPPGSADIQTTTDIKTLTEADIGGEIVVNAGNPVAIPGTTKISTVSLLPIEVNVNDTADAKDDMVRKEQKIGTTAWRQWIPCTVKIPSASNAQITSIGVTAESGTMKFSDAQAKPGDSDAGAANVNVTLDAQGRGKFWITGITQSANKGDAKLQIRKNGATGDVLATQPMTVFWFDAKIIFPSQSAASKSGNLYGITNAQYPWTFCGEATVKPTGLDATAPQVANMRLGFVQNVQTTRKWHVNNPSVQAGSGAPTSSTVTVASTRVGTVTWQGYVLDTRPLALSTPFYHSVTSFDASAKATIDSDDSPQAPADTHSKAAQAIQGNQTWPVTVDYQWEKTVIQDDFLLWLGVADADNTGLLPTPPSVVPIRQVDWKFHADSSASVLQQPTGGTHKAPDTVPVVTGQTANQRGANPANYQWQDGNQNTYLHP